jgi:hypothetical protein
MHIADDRFSFLTSSSPSLVAQIEHGRIVIRRGALLDR